MDDAENIDVELRRTLDERASENLRLLLWVFSGVYVVFGIGTARLGQFVHPEGWAVMVSIMFGTAALLLIARVVLGWRGLRPARAHAGLTALLALILTTMLARLYYTADPMIGLAPAVIVLLFSFLIHVRALLLSGIAYGFVVWLAVVSTFSYDVGWVRVGFGLMAAAAVAVALQANRLRAVREDLRKTRRLELALEEARAARQAEQKARAVAEAASRVKSDFLAHVSHEIRTPMNAVIGMTRLLLDTTLSDDQREYAETVQSSGEGLLAIINDLLDLSKIEAGKLDLEDLDLDVGALAGGVGDMLREQAESKGLALTCAVDETIPRNLRGDTGRLRQILINLVGNAVKFTAAGEVAIRVRRVQLPEVGGKPNPHLRFEVRDTGIGISEEVRAHLFDPFVQADASTNRKYGGTGLGLAICRQLTNLMGGELGVDSVVGEGSTFWFQIPMVLGSSGSSQSFPDASAARPETLRAPAEGLELLVVEDNAVNRRLIDIILRRMGYGVTMVVDGREGVDAVAQGRFDAVLMDVQMPVMGGIEATQAIRRLEASGDRERTPIIAMTANAMSSERERCLGAGMDGYLTKPIDVPALAAELTRQIRAQRERPPNAHAAVG